MLDLTNLNYLIKEDIENYMISENLTALEFSKSVDISNNTLMEILKGNKPNNKICETIYSYFYKNGYRFNIVKEEFLKEINKSKILFHGAKNDLNIVSHNGSRSTCDFGEGFYLGEHYEHALSFVCENSNSSVYSFVFDPKDLKIVELDASIEWMLAICYFRGTIKQYENSKMLKDILNKISEADVIIAPIADNKMFYIMSSFANGDINLDVALHSLSASNLGKQFVFKTEKALSCLYPIEKYYLSELEKNECSNRLIQRSFEIDAKLKLAKREFKDGLYIEELLK